MCAGIQNPSDPRYSCDCHLWKQEEMEEEYDPLDEYFARADYEYEKYLDDEADDFEGDNKEYNDDDLYGDGIEWGSLL